MAKINSDANYPVTSTFPSGSTVPGTRGDTEATVQFDAVAFVDMLNGTYERRRQFWAAGEWLTPPTAAVSSFAFANGDMRLAQINIPGTVTLDRISTEVVTAGVGGAVVRLVIYEDADGDGVADTLVLDAGTVDGTSTGQKDLTISQAVTAGPLWIAAINQAGSTPATLRFISADGEQLRYSGATWTGTARMATAQRQTGITGAAPASITPNLAEVNPPRVAVRRA